MFRLATYNLENLETGVDQEQKTNFAERKKILTPMLNRLQADAIAFQEIHSQTLPDGTKKLEALEELLAETNYSDYELITTTTEDQPYSQRNLVIASRFPIKKVDQAKHKFIPAPKYRPVTADPQEEDADEITWERPILHVEADLSEVGIDAPLHILNLHLKSKNPTSIPGGKLDRFTWGSPSAWAEGYFLSSLRRVGQALETRTIVDSIFADDENANIAVVGDFNADFDEVPVEAILGRVENTGNGELARRELVPCELSVPETSRFSLYHHGKPYMLDHIIISRNLLTNYSHTEIHNETLADESIAFATDIKFPEPDHAAVIAQFNSSN